MGCHTWCYRKIEISYEEAKEKVLETYKESFMTYTNWINNPLDMEYLNMLSVYSEYTYDYIYEQQQVLNRLIRVVNKGLCKEAVMHKFASHSEEIMVYIPGKGMYVEVDGYHDLFRKYGYPETQLFSLQESLDYIKDPENHCVVYDDGDFSSVKYLKEFWTKYPDGMIDFG